MAVFIWPAEDGWPYPDPSPEMADPDADPDEDLLSVRASGGHLLDHLDSIEKQVITARFGLDGSGAHSMKEIQATTGLAREDLRRIMGSGLSKLRADLR